MLSVAMSVSPFSAGDLRSIFYYWRSVLAENALKRAFLGLVFSCFAFLIFLLFGNHPERVCAAMFLRSFILFASLLSDSAPTRRARAGFAGRTCTGLACAGSALPSVSVLRQVLQGGLASDGLVPGGLVPGQLVSGRLCRVGFTGSALPGWLCRVGLRRPSGSHKGLRWPFSRIFA